MALMLKKEPGHQDILNNIALIRYYARLRNNPNISPEARGLAAHEFFIEGLKDKASVSYFFPCLEIESWAEFGYKMGYDGDNKSLGNYSILDDSDQNNYDIGFRVGRIVKTSEMDLKLP
jgi:hypothetical protein